MNLASRVAGGVDVMLDRGEAACPPGWRCQTQASTTTSVCSCTRHEERCNGLDDDRNGVVAHAEMSHPVPAQASN